MSTESILEEFARGTLSAMPAGFEPDSPEDQMVKSLAELRTKLFETLDEGEKELFAGYGGIQAELQCKLNIDCFIRGFKLGMRMAAEVCAED